MRSQLLTLMPSVIGAFCSSSSRRLLPGHSFVRTAHPTSQLLTQHYAIIYGADGEVLEEEENTLNTTPTPTVLLETVSSQLNMGLLIRVACAFAPPPHSNLHPNDVESAHVVSVDSTKLEIAVAIPSADGSGGCVQLLVPVVFPTPPDATRSEDPGLVVPIVEYMNQLDAQAYERIAENERRQDNFEEIAIQQRLLQTLKEEPSGEDLPDWWTFPELKITLSEECSSMKSLLNQDDFAAELRVLGQVHHSSSSRGGNERVLQARVAAVGPSGLLLRAQVEQKLTEDDDIEKDLFSIIEVGIPYDEEAGSADQLRSSVLRLVESVQQTSTETVFQEEAEAKAAAAKAEAEKKVKANKAEAAEAKAKAKADEEEARVKAEAEDKAKAEAESKAKVEEESRRKVEAEAKAEEKVRLERKAKSEAEEEARLRAEVEAKAAAEEEARRIKALRIAEVKQRGLLVARLAAKAKEWARRKAAMEAKTAREEAVAKARQQPKPTAEEKSLARRYGAMDLEERAYSILVDLGMIELHPDPDGPDYNREVANEFAPDNVYV